MLQAVITWIGGNGQLFITEFQITCRYSPLQEVKLNCPYPFCGMDWLTCFQIVSNGKNSNFRVGKPGKHYISQMIKVNVTSDKSCWYHAPPGMWWEGHFTSVIFLPQTYNFSLIMRKTSDPDWGAFYKIIDQFFSHSVKIMRLRRHAD